MRKKNYVLRIILNIYIYDISEFLLGSVKKQIEVYNLFVE